jgi:hypothetical protein
MTLQDYQLEETILKTSEEKTLWQTEKGIVKIRKNTLVLPILLDGHRNGYVFHENGELLIDTIVETEEGAMGKPVEKEANKPFLLIGAKENLLQNLDTAQQEDIQRAGYNDEKGFLVEADKICNRILGRKRGYNYRLSNFDRGLVFAFSNETDSPDILVTKGSKLVYKAVGVVFVSSEDKSILKDHGAVVLSNHGKSFLIKR